MGDIRFNCPACRGKLVVDSAASGHHANCPHCRKRLLIPRESDPVQKTAASDPSPFRPTAGPNAASFLTTTQKIADDRTSLPSPLDPRAAVATLPKSAVRLPERPKEVPRVLGGDALNEDARQRLTDLIQGLQRENADLRRQLAAAAIPRAPAPEDTAERAQWQQERAALESRVSALETDLAAARREAEEALEAAARTAQEKESLALELSVRMTACSDAEARRDATACQMEEIQAALRSVQSDWAALQLEHFARTAELDRVRAELAAALIDRDRCLTDAVHARREAARATAACDAIGAKMATVSADLERARLALQRSLSETEDLKRSLQQAGVEARHSRDQIERLGDELERLSSERQALVVAHEDLKTRLDDALAASRSATEESEDLNAQLVSTRSRIAELEQVVASARAESAAASQATAALSGLRERLSALEEENKRLQQQAGAKDRDERIRMDPAAMPIQTARTMRKIEELESTLRTADAFARGLKARVAALEAENARLQATVAPGHPRPT